MWRRHGALKTFHCAFFVVGYVVGLIKTWREKKISGNGTKINEHWVLGFFLWGGWGGMFNITAIWKIPFYT